MTSKCCNCMVLIRLLILNGLIHNRRLAARYVNTKKNVLADSLSRNQMRRFRKLGLQMDETPTQIHESLWPITKYWLDE